MEKVIGLIAGQGRLPFLVADGARRAGFRVICVGLGDNAEASLAEHTDIFHKVPLARVGCWIRRLKKYGVSTTIMVGRVAKKRIYTPWRIVRYLPDWRAVRIWYWRLRGKDKRNDTLLCALADELASGEIYLESSIMYCKEHLATEGVMTACGPGPFVKADIDFGWEIVSRLGELDIGQAIAVKEREVIAVEAIEGTARMIERAGRLCPKGGWTLIKAAKPNQDMRFDVPCIGPDTVESLASSGGKCIVLQKDTVVIIDKPETIALANRLGIAIVGY